MNKKVYAGLSGGVDSAVCAKLLIDEGYDVTAFTLKLWNDDRFGEITEIGRASEVASHLGIPHEVFNLSDEFYKYVVSPFGEEYMKGRTPNPCVVCNKYIKFGKVFDLIPEDAFVATGHYSSVVFEDGVYKIKKAKDIKKDQTYMHYNLTQDNLKRIIFPLASKTKDEVREIAKEIGLSCHSDKDSQDICFIKNKGYKEFLKDELSLSFTPGKFVDVNGNVLGEHKGICEYTVGQRKGLGAFGKPMFVNSINPMENTVVLGEAGTEFTNEIKVKDFNFIYEIPAEPRMLDVKVRYSQKTEKGKLIHEGDILRIEFETPVRAAAPGQSAVFYDGEYLYGGGIII